MHRLVSYANPYFLSRCSCNLLTCCITTRCYWPLSLFTFNITYRRVSEINFDPSTLGNSYERSQKDVTVFVTCQNVQFHTLCKGTMYISMYTFMYFLFVCLRTAWWRTHRLAETWIKVQKIRNNVVHAVSLLCAHCVLYNHVWYDIFVNCNWLATRWQLYSTHIHTNNTQNDRKQTIHRIT
jgi:hypothetical protein